MEIWTKPFKPMRYIDDDGTEIERWEFLEGLWTGETGVLLLTGPGFVKLETAVLLNNLSQADAELAFEDWARDTKRFDEIGATLEDPYPEKGYECVAFEIKLDPPNNLMTLKLDRLGCLHIFPGLVDTNTKGQNVVYDSKTRLTSKWFFQPGIDPQLGKQKEPVTPQQFFGQECALTRVKNILPKSMWKELEAGWNVITDLLTLEILGEPLEPRFISPF